MPEAEDGGDRRLRSDGPHILAVLLEGALDGNAVDIEQIRHNRSVFFGVAFGLMAGVFGISGSAPVVGGLYILGLPSYVGCGHIHICSYFQLGCKYRWLLLFGRLNITLIILLGGRFSSRCICRAVTP